MGEDGVCVQPAVLYHPGSAMSIERGIRGSSSHSVSVSIRTHTGSWCTYGTMRFALRGMCVCVFQADGVFGRMMYVLISRPTSPFSALSRTMSPVFPFVFLLLLVGALSQSNDGTLSCVYNTEHNAYVCSEQPCLCVHGGICTGVPETPCKCHGNRFGRICELSAYECAFRRCHGPSEMCSATGVCVARTSSATHSYPIVFYVLFALSVGTSLASIVAIVRMGVDSTLARLANRR